MTLLYCGVPPSEVDNMPVSDLLLFMEALPTLVRLTNGYPDGLT
jgi:hypothetical protein